MAIITEIETSRGIEAFASNSSKGVNHQILKKLCSRRDGQILLGGLVQVQHAKSVAWSLGKAAEIEPVICNCKYAMHTTNIYQPFRS